MTNTNDRDKRVLAMVADVKATKEEMGDMSVPELIAVVRGPEPTTRPPLFDPADRTKLETGTYPPAS